MKRARVITYIMKLYIYIFVDNILSSIFVTSPLIYSPQEPKVRSLTVALLRKITRPELRERMGITLYLFFRQQARSATSGARNKALGSNHYRYRYG